MIPCDDILIEAWQNAFQYSEPDQEVWIQYMFIYLMPNYFQRCLLFNHLKKLLSTAYSLKNLFSISSLTIK